ncbi:efflux transporter outer membrane subunit [Vibrio sp. WXL210]|uniref:efflux transporter outer membrane subunit n=1 Tax=Vibrio sp. WXL210 TaxID=3450709 RepID=UPI003EC8F1F1
MPFQFRTFALGVLSLALTGCSLQPTPHQPLHAFEQQGFTISGQAPVNAEWWLTFDDPELTRLIEIGLADNISLQTSIARVHRAAEIANVDRAARFPDASAKLDTNLERGNTRNGINTSNNESLGLNARWELDIWGKNKASATASYFNYLATDQRLHAAGQALAGDIARVWFQLTEQQQSMAILARQISNTQVIAEITAHQYRSGQGSVSAIWRQEQLLESLKSSQNQAFKNRAVLEKQLNVLIGRPPMQATDWQYSHFPTYPMLPDTGLPAQLIERRPDIQSSWYQYLASQEQITVAKANRLPDINLAGGGALQDWSSDFELWRVNLGAQVNVPIFNAGKLAARERAAQAASDIAFLDYTQAVLKALEEIETNTLREMSQYNQLASLERQTEQAAQILEVESIRYRQGMQGYLDVLNAQEKLFALQKQSLSAKRQLFLRRVATYQSLGGDLDRLTQRPEPQ